MGTWARPYRVWDGWHCGAPSVDCVRDREVIRVVGTAVAVLAFEALPRPVEIGRVDLRRGVVRGEGGNDRPHRPVEIRPAGVGCGAVDRVHAGDVPVP